MLPMEGADVSIYLGKATICCITARKYTYERGSMSEKPTIPDAPDARLAALITAHVAATDRRVSMLEYQGQTIWVKKLEKLSLRMRLQKGDPSAAFLAERTALHRLQAAGVPVPRIVAEGPDYIAITDSGPSLKRLLLGLHGPSITHLDAFEAAGKQLALMHKQQLSHGRPSVKDICWKDGRITFLDFERFHDKRNTPKGHMQDLVMMVFSAYAITGRDCPEIEALITGYRCDDPADIWQAAAKWCAQKGWVDILTKPVQWRGAGKALEFKAIPLTIRAFGRPPIAPPAPKTGQSGR